MGYLIDTCIISELRKKQCDAGVVSWMSAVDPEDAYISMVTVGEIRRGIELRRARDPLAASVLEKWLAGLEAHYADRILPVTSVIADRWGRLAPDQPLPVSDGLIAATALEYGLAIVTRNTGDFSRTGVTLVNPFSK
jgi:predicted nucleic acid-binding protein